MILHVFNSSVVSGPETLVMPALTRLGAPAGILLLCETRLAQSCAKVADYARSLGLPVWTVAVRSRWDRAAFAELLQQLQTIHPIWIHAHDVKASLYVHQALKKNPTFRSRVKTASTHHGTAARKGLIRVYEEFYVRWVLPHYDQILAMSEGDYHSLVRRGVPNQRLQIHLNGVDRIKIAPSDRTATQRHIHSLWGQAKPESKLDPTLPRMPRPKEIILGVVARLSPEKRHDRILQALARIKKRNPTLPWKLVCFGIGPEEESLKALTENLGLSQEVCWMGYRSTIGAEFAGFDLVLALSDGEGIPVNFLEAGWAATPVFTSKVGGIPDLIPSEKYGFLVDKKQTDEQISQALERALSDPQKRSEIGWAFQDRVERQFSEKTWLQQLRQVYNLNL